MRVVQRELNNRVGNAFIGAVLVAVVWVYLAFKGGYAALSDQLTVPVDGIARYTTDLGGLANVAQPLCQLQYIQFLLYVQIEHGRLCRFAYFGNNQLTASKERCEAILICGADFNFLFSDRLPQR